MTPYTFYQYSQVNPFTNRVTDQVLWCTPSGYFIRALNVGSDFYIPDSTSLVKGIQDLNHLKKLREDTLEERILFLSSYISFSTSWSQFIPRFYDLLVSVRKISRARHNLKKINIICLTTKSKLLTCL